LALSSTASSRRFLKLEKVGRSNREKDSLKGVHQTSNLQSSKCMCLITAFVTSGTGTFQSTCQACEVTGAAWLKTIMPHTIDALEQIVAGLLNSLPESRISSFACAAFIFEENRSRE
jgi:hypothetical protein